MKAFLGTWISKMGVKNELKRSVAFDVLRLRTWQLEFLKCNSLKLELDTECYLRKGRGILVVRSEIVCC